MKSPFLSFASSYGAPYGVMDAVLDIGGKDLLALKNKKGATVVHSGIQAPLAIIVSTLISTSALSRPN